MIYHQISISQRELTAGTAIIPDIVQARKIAMWRAGTLLQLSDTPSSTELDVDLRIHYIRAGFDDHPAMVGLAPSPEAEISISNSEGTYDALTAPNPVAFTSAPISILRLDGVNPPLVLFSGRIASCSVTAQRVTFVCRGSDLAEASLGTSRGGSIPLIWGDFTDEDAYAPLTTLASEPIPCAPLGFMHTLPYTWVSMHTGAPGRSIGTYPSPRLIGDLLYTSPPTTAQLTLSADLSTANPADHIQLRALATAPTPSKVMVGDECVSLCTQVPSGAHTPSGSSPNLFVGRGLDGTTAKSHPQGEVIRFIDDLGSSAIYACTLPIQSAYVTATPTHQAYLRASGSPADFASGGTLAIWTTATDVTHPTTAHIKVGIAALPTTAKAHTLTVSFDAVGNFGLHSSSYAPATHIAIAGAALRSADGWPAMVPSGPIGPCHITKSIPVANGDLPREIAISLGLSTGWLKISNLRLTAEAEDSTKPDKIFVKAKQPANSTLIDQLATHANLWAFGAVTANGTLPPRAEGAGPTKGTSYRDHLRDLAHQLKLAIHSPAQGVWRVQDPISPVGSVAGPTPAELISPNGLAIEDYHISMGDAQSLYTEITLRWRHNSITDTWQVTTVTPTSSTTKWNLPGTPLTAQALMAKSLSVLPGASRALVFDAPLIRTADQAHSLIMALCQIHSKPHKIVTMRTSMAYAYSSGLDLFTEITPRPTTPKLQSMGRLMLIARDCEPQSNVATLRFLEI